MLMMTRKRSRGSSSGTSEEQQQHGLYIQQPHTYYYAEPKAGVRCYRFQPPPGYECLARGSCGDTFVSLDRRRVRKYFENPETAEHEGRVFRRVVELAPQYSPGSESDGDGLIRARCVVRGERAYHAHALQMQNAGPLLSERALSLDELCLCLLQTIDFISRLGAAVRVADIHANNICVRGTGAQVEVRWIDYGLWELLAAPADTSPQARRYVLRNNLCLLLSPSAWQCQLRRFETERLDELLLECEENASTLDWAVVVRAAVDSLSALARSLCALLNRAGGLLSSTPLARARAEALWAEVEPRLLLLMAVEEKAGWTRRSKLEQAATLADGK